MSQFWERLEDSDCLQASHPDVECGVKLSRRLASGVRVIAMLDINIYFDEENGKLVCQVQQVIDIVASIVVIA